MTVPISAGAYAALQRIETARRNPNPDLAHHLLERMQAGLFGEDPSKQTQAVRAIEAANLAGRGHAELWMRQAEQRLLQAFGFATAAGISSVAIPGVAPVAGVLAQTPAVPLEILNSGLHMVNHNIPGNVVSSVAHFGGDAMSHGLSFAGHLGGLGALIAAGGALGLASWRGSLGLLANGTQLVRPSGGPLGESLAKFFGDKLNLGGLWRPVAEEVA